MNRTKAAMEKLDAKALDKIRGWGDMIARDLLDERMTGGHGGNPRHRSTLRGVILGYLSRLQDEEIIRQDEAETLYHYFASAREEDANT